MSRCQVGRDKRAASNSIWRCKTSEIGSKWQDGAFIGIRNRSDEMLILTPSGVQNEECSETLRFGVLGIPQIYQWTNTMARVHIGECHKRLENCVAEDEDKIQMRGNKVPSEGWLTSAVESTDKSSGGDTVSHAPVDLRK